MSQRTSITCHIDSFSIFKRSIAISGWAFCRHGTIAEITLNLPKGGIYSLGIPNLPSPDVAAVHGEVASYSRFDIQVLVSESPEEILNAKLIIHSLQGVSHIVNELSRTPSKESTHEIMEEFFSKLRARSVGKFLEVGSRARSGGIRKNLVPESWSYTGLDIVAGENVDVVGDAHGISKLFPGEKFDAVGAFSVLEHILMPWKFIIELNKILDIGAIGFFSTHQCWPLHDVPWDFWRFSDNAWPALLNRDTGFEIISTALSDPAFTVSQRINTTTNFGSQPGFLSSVVQFRKISETKLEWPVELKDIITTKYPAGNQEPEKSSKFQQ